MIHLEGSPRIKEWSVTAVSFERSTSCSTRNSTTGAAYGLPYTTGPLARQFALTQRTILKLALPDRLLIATPDDAPETASELRFA